MARIVGLDIGSSAVRAVEVQTRGHHHTVRRAGRVPLPVGVVEAGQVRRPAEVTKALRRLWHENRFSTKAVRLGIGSGSVLVRQVELDWMPPQDLRKAMRYLVADLIPVPVDQANVDHVLLEESEVPGGPGEEGRRVVRILLTAAARDGVDDVVRCVRGAGLRPVVADLAPLALVRAATALSSNEPFPGTEAIVDVGADKVAVVVHSEGRARFVRVIPGVGGDSITRMLAELSGTGLDQANDLKLHLALADHTSRTPSDPATVRHLLRRASQHVVEEVETTLGFYNAGDPSHPPTRLRLTGVGASVVGFDDLCSTQLGLAVSPLITAPEVTRRRRRGTLPAPDLAVSFGLCLGATA